MSKEAFYSALNRKVGYEVVTESITERQLRIEGRVQQAQMSMWKAVREALFDKEGTSTWTIDISKHYFKRGIEKYAWRIIVQAPNNLDDRLAELAAIVISAQPPYAEIMEYPLHAPANRNALVRGKGAQGTLVAVVGPMAAAALKEGG